MYPLATELDYQIYERLIVTAEYKSLTWLDYYIQYCVVPAFDR